MNPRSSGLSHGSTNSMFKRAELTGFQKSRASVALEGEEKPLDCRRRSDPARPLETNKSEISAALLSCDEISESHTIKGQTKSGCALNSQSSLGNSRNINLDCSDSTDALNSCSLEKKSREEFVDRTILEAFAPSFEDDFTEEYRVSKSQFESLRAQLKTSHVFLFDCSMKEDFFGPAASSSTAVVAFSFELPVSMTKTPKVLNGKYRLGDRISEGTFGEVFIVTDIASGKSFVAKMIKARGGHTTMDPDSFNQSLSEIATLRKLLTIGSPDSHRFVELVDFFWSNGFLFLVFEKLGESLKDIVCKKKPLSVQQIKEALKDSLKCLHFLHRHNLIHGDLKPENILFTDSACERVKLIDFGTSIALEEVSDQPVHSLLYRAPEVILKRHYDAKVDMWALGASFYFLITRHLLFRYRSEHQILAKAMSINDCLSLSFSSVSKNPAFFSQNLLTFEENKNSLRVFVPKPFKDIDSSLREVNCPKLLIDLLKKCLTLDPRVRLSSAEALKHPFFD